MTRLPISWWQLVRRTAGKIADDNCVGLAAQLAFYLLLAVFPALLFLVTLIGYLPVEHVLDELFFTLASVAPFELVDLLRAQAEQVAEGSRASVLTLGMVGALWSSSAAMVALIEALNHAYEVAEWRPWWKRRITAILLTVELAVLTILAFVLVLVGPDWAGQLARWFGVGPLVALAWRLARWPVMMVCAAAAVMLVYQFAPNRRASWIRLAPGTVLATTLWIVASFGFKFYVATFADYAATYGAIGAAIVTMLWFYVSALAILVGAELNAVIEGAWRPVGADEA